MNKLRKQIVNLVDTKGYTWYRIAEDTGIRQVTLYRFRDGGGLDGENTIKLIAYLGLNAKELL